MECQTHLKKNVENLEEDGSETEIKEMKRNILGTAYLIACTQKASANIVTTEILRDFLISDKIIFEILEVK